MAQFDLSCVGVPFYTNQSNWVVYLWLLISESGLFILARSRRYRRVIAVLLAILHAAL